MRVRETKKSALIARVTNVSLFACDCPHFSTESPVSQSLSLGLPQSQAKVVNQLGHAIPLANYISSFREYQHQMRTFLDVLE